eukprot:scaffold22093_cov145-Isochrysis_galbana.AAC.1
MTKQAVRVLTVIWSRGGPSPEYYGSVGAWTAPRPHRPPRSPRRPRCLDAREKPLGGHIFIGGGAECARREWAVNVHRYRRGGMSSEFTGVPAGVHRGEGPSHVPAGGLRV